MDEDAAWFAGLQATDETGLADRIDTGEAGTPHDWPDLAVDTGFVPDRESYYSALHSASVTATAAAVEAAERADDQQLIHLVRSMDDAERTANELAERVGEWYGTRDPGFERGVEAVRELTDVEPADTLERRIVTLAGIVDTLLKERDALRSTVEQRAPSVAPNLAALAGPVLAARLIALAGGLEALAKLPSGTVQVLGAEDALFAHLQGSAPSPKHGVIYTHPAVRGTRAADRGSAARAVAGKLSIAARIDHYSGDYRPDLERDLADRITTIQNRGSEGDE